MNLGPLKINMQKITLIFFSFFPSLGKILEGVGGRGVYWAKQRWILGREISFEELDFGLPSQERTLEVSFLY